VPISSRSAHFRVRSGWRNGTKPFASNRHWAHGRGSLDEWQSAVLAPWLLRN